MKRAKERNITSFKPLLLPLPCSVCGKPVPFTHNERPGILKDLILMDLEKLAKEFKVKHNYHSYTS
jgi:hypothetical protein